MRHRHPAAPYPQAQDAKNAQRAGWPGGRGPGPAARGATRAEGITRRHAPQRQERQPKGPHLLVQARREPPAASTQGLGPRSAQILVSAFRGSPHLRRSTLSIGYFFVFAGMEQKKSAPKRETSSLTIASMTIFSSLSLYYCLCRFEVTVTSVTLSPFMSHRGLVNTNQRLSLYHESYSTAVASLRFHYY